MADISDIYERIRAHQSRQLSAEEQIMEAMIRADITPPELIKIDGQLHRFVSEEGRKSRNGWYIIYPDGVPAGRFGCWRRDIDCQFRANMHRELTPAEQMQNASRMRSAIEARDRERAKMAEVVADVVEDIWGSAASASADHPYLARKCVGNYGLRITGDGRLIVPMYRAGDLVSLQYISDSEKKFHNGAPVSGAFFVIGSGPAAYLCEGYSTAATIHEATGKAVAIAFNASNLPAVAASIREAHGPTHTLCIVADKDDHGVGEKYARRAAEQSGCRVVVSPVSSDVNDYAAQGGDVLALLEPPDQWLMPADAMCEKPAPLKWLVKRWLQSEALIMVHGPSGAGKTFVVLDLAARISAGVEEWRGHKVTPGAVVYLAGEGHHGLRSRLAAWRQHMGLESLGKMWLSKSGCDLNTPAGYMQIVEHVRQLPERPALIIVDTLHRFLAGDENSAQDAKTMLDACAGLTSEFGCAVLLVHHTGVSEEAQHRARGSSSWKGGLDNEISVCGGKIEQKKMKDSELCEPVHFELSTIPIVGWLDEDGEQVTSAVVIEADAPMERPKIDKKLEESRKLLEAAWFGHAGCEVLEDSPYISRAAMRAKLQETGKADRTIVNELNPSYDDLTIGRLIGAGIISPALHGWIISDPEYSSALMMRTAGSRVNE